MAETEQITIITNRDSALKGSLKKLWASRYLVLLFANRDFSVIYKQTIFGPLWYIIQPILTALVLALVFGRVANLSVDNVPHILFFYCSIILWTFFSETFSGTSDIFKKHNQLFEKIYFPRLLVVLSTVLLNAFKLILQFGIFFFVLLYFMFNGFTVEYDWRLILLPIIIAGVGLFGISLGMIFSSFSIKYRDLTLLTGFVIQVLFFLSPVIYPIAKIPEKLIPIFLVNPLCMLLDGFRSIIFDRESLGSSNIIISSAFLISFFLFAFWIFHRAERNSIDTI